MVAVLPGLTLQRGASCPQIEAKRATQKPPEMRGGGTNQPDLGLSVSALWELWPQP